MTDRPDPTAVVVRRNIEGMLFLTRGNQSDLAESMRLVQGNVSRKLTGVATISLDDLDRIAAHFGITVADLVTPGCMPASHMIAVET